MQTFDSLGTKYIDFIPIPHVPKHGIYGDESGNICVAINGVKVATLNIPGGGSDVVVALTVAALQALTAAQPSIVVLQGWHAPNDGGGGTFVWNSASTATVDGGTIFAVTGVGVGRYIRVYTGALYAAWFGTVGNGIANDTIALQNAINAAVNKTLIVTDGTYLVSLGGSAGGASPQNALRITNPTMVIWGDNAKLLLAPMGALPIGWGTGASNVIGVLTIQSSNVKVVGGQFDWNIANSTVHGYTSLIYVTTNNPGVGGPYFNNVVIDGGVKNGMKIRNSRGAGIWTEDTSQLWVQNTNHAGGTGTDILVLRSLINLFDVHVDDNYIDSSTMPPAVGAPIQLSINFTGSAGLTTDRWSMNNNTVYAGLNTNVYYTMTQIYAPFNPDGANGVWRHGSACGNILEGAIGGGGPLGGAEAISAVNVVDSNINNNNIKNCYIGIEMVGFGNTCVGNTIDGGGLYMQLGILMDGGSSGCTVSNNVIRGFGVWDNYQGIPCRGTRCTITGNTIVCPFGSGVNGTGIILYVDGQNAALGDDRNVVSNNVMILGGASLGLDFYDVSQLVAHGNIIDIETPTFSPIRLQAPGTVGHATRDFISIANNNVKGGALPVVNQVASADWGTNIYCQTTRIEPNPNKAWTPVLAFGGASVGVTYSVQVGSYTQVGKVITAEGHIILTSKGSSVGNVTISGLPVAANASFTGPSNIAYYQNMATITSIGAYVQTGTTVLHPTNAGAAGHSPLTDANFTNTTEIYFSTTYLIDG